MTRMSRILPLEVIYFPIAPSKIKTVDKKR